MIDTIYFAIGFIVYIGFGIITFDVYAKKKELTKIFMLIFIYLFYTVLALYLINLVDRYADFIERLIQMAIYAVAGAIFLYSHYKTVIEKSDIEAGYGESPDSKIF